VFSADNPLLNKLPVMKATNNIISAMKATHNLIKLVELPTVVDIFSADMF